MSSLEIDDAVQVELARLEARAQGAGARAIAGLTLADVFVEVLTHSAHLEWSQDELEKIRRMFGLKPRPVPQFGNVVRFEPRPRSAPPAEGPNAA